MAQTPSYYKTVSSVTLTNNGSNYTTATVSFSGGGGGTGATATPVIVNGKITAINVTSGGYNYTTPPTVTITGNGVNATAVSTVDNTDGAYSGFKESLNYLISNQLPEFVQNEYPQFVLFLKKYYEFLDQQGQVNNFLLNADGLNDINRTLDIFVPSFANQYLKDFPADSSIDQRTLIKFIRQFYEAKGSEKSIELLFRMLYATEIEVIYPSEQILRASDGIWARDTVIRISLDEQTTDPFELSGKFAKIYSHKTTGSVTYQVTQDVTVTDVRKLAYITPPIYELTIERRDTNTILIPGAAATATANRVGTTIGTITVDSGGSGYYAAPAVNILSITGSGATARAVLDSTGHISSIVVVTAGSGYSTGIGTLAATVATSGTAGQFTCGASTLAVGNRLTITGTPAVETLAATVAVSGTAGQFTCGASTLAVGSLLRITGTKGGTATITGYATGTTYKVSAVTGTSPNVTGFTLTTQSNVAIVTTAGTLTGLTYTTTGTITGYNTAGTIYKVSAVTGTSPNVTGFTLTTQSGAAIVTTAGKLTGLTYVTETVTPTVVFDNTNIRTRIELATDNTTIYGYIIRVLNSVSIGTGTLESGETDYGFQPNQIYQIDESGAVGLYAVSGYFAGDYVASGLDNNASIKIDTIDEDGLPTEISIFYSGYAFEREIFDFTIVSPNGGSVDLTFTTGAEYTRPGRFKDSRGMLSNVNKLQDNYYYQNYSYVIRSDIPQNRWTNVVKNTVHPAGMAVFGELSISQTVDYSPNIGILEEKLHLYEFVTDSITISDSGMSAFAVTFVKVLTDSISTPTDAKTIEFGKNVTDATGTSTDVNIISFGKNVSDSITSSEEVNSITFSKVLTDSVTVTESLIIGQVRDFADASTPTEQAVVSFEKPFDDATAATTDNNVILIGKNVSDATGSTTEAINEIVFGKVITESITPVELFEIVIGKILTDSFTPIDAGNINIQNYWTYDYTSGEYDSGDYVGTNDTF